MIPKQGRYHKWYLLASSFTFGGVLFLVGKHLWWAVGGVQIPGFNFVGLFLAWFQLRWAVYRQLTEMGPIWGPTTLTGCWERAESDLQLLWGQNVGHFEQSFLVGVLSTFLLPILPVCRYVGACEKAFAFEPTQRCMHNQVGRCTYTNTSTSTTTSTSKVYTFFLKQPGRCTSTSKYTTT